MNDELGIIGFIGFSYNKFLVKVVFDLDKLCGFLVIGVVEIVLFLSDKLVCFIWGIGLVV